MAKFIETENISLAGVQTELEKRAGAETLTKFGYINVVNSLANGNVLLWKEIVNLSYETFYLKRLHLKIETEFNKKYQELLAKQK